MKPGMPVNPAFFALISGGVSALTFWLGQRAMKKAQRIEETPTSRIKDLKPGLREVKGRVRAQGPTLASPMSGKRCVYYHFKVEQKHSHHRGKGSKSHWTTVVNDRQGVLAMVDDGTGQASVDLPRAELRLTTDSRARSGIFNDAPASLEHTLNERYGRSSVGFVFNKEMRYSETVLEEGDEVYVIGQVTVTGGKASIGAGGELFLVSDQGEAAVLGSLKTEMWVAYLFAVGAAVVTVILVIAGLRHH